jgi:hypothetical protein
MKKASSKDGAFFMSWDSNEVGSGEHLVSRRRKELETVGVQKVARRPREMSQAAHHENSFIARWSFFHGEIQT